MGVIREGRLKDGHGELHLYCGEDGKGAGDSGNVGPSVVEILEAAMFVVWETVYLFASVCPRLEDACGVASANGVKLKSGRWCGTVAGWLTDGWCVGDTKGCGKHFGTRDWQSGVGVNGDVVKDLEECLLVGDQSFDLSHGNLQLLDELLPLLRDE